MEKDISILVERKYRVVSKIGEGTFSKIFKGVTIVTVVVAFMFIGIHQYICSNAKISYHILG